jgi:hypothetical protein
MKHSPAHAAPRAASRFVAMVALIAGLALRVVGALGRLDQPLWREGDLVAIARSFQREDLNILHPRIAWRGTTAGLVEGEFPIVPWVVGAAWRLTGETLWMMRVIPFLSGLLALLMFWLIARRWVRDEGARFALAFFAVSPLAVFLSSAVQSDGVMLFAIVWAVWSAMHWTDVTSWRSSRRWPLSTAAAIALAGLMKLPALHVGIAIVAVIVVRQGWRALFRLSTLFTLALGAAIPVLWSVYAHSLYRDTKLSLGVSNEHHIAGSELFTNPELLKGIANQELRLVIGLGAIPILVALWRGRRTEIVRISFVWLLGVAAMLLVAGRTTADPWAFYYHAAAIPPVALLVGVGCAEILNMLKAWSFVNKRAGVRVVLATLLGVALAAPGAKSAVGLVRPRSESALFRCAQQVAPSLPSEGLVLVSGGVRLDDRGNQVAYDASYLFHWLDRRGWTIAVEDQTLKQVESFRDDGAVMYLAERDAFLNPASPSQTFEQELRNTYSVLAECDETLVAFDLR